MTLTFGTDGVRGDARSELTPKFVEALGHTAAQVLGDSFAVGRDPRVSGPELVAAFCRGVRHAGGEIVDLGVLPTPAVARWCGDEQVAGAMVSASHNPWHDNGVKLFARGGHKLTDEAQQHIERLLAGLLADDQNFDSGKLRLSSEILLRQDAARRRHVEAVASSIKGRDLKGLRIVVDAANGAACWSAPECLRQLNAEVLTIHASPDGHNINQDCGSLHPASLQQAVVSNNADAGLAFDGDADRVLAVDCSGDLIDGDQILAICALDRADRGLLTGAAVVVTVMSNLGLRQALTALDIDIVETPVGDRHVLAELEQRQLVLGGEQSGHLIFRDLATTGDGLLTAVQLLDTVKRVGQDLRSLAAASMTRMPQTLLAVPLPSHRADNINLEALLSSIADQADERLGASGRVLLRPSGTEPLVRVMVEAADAAIATATAEQLAAQVSETLKDHQPLSPTTCSNSSDSGNSNDSAGSSG